MLTTAPVFLRENWRLGSLRERLKFRLQDQIVLALPKGSNRRWGSRKDSDKVRDKVFLGTPLLDPSTRQDPRKY